MVRLRFATVARPWGRRGGGNIAEESPQFSCCAERCRVFGRVFAEVCTVLLALIALQRSPGRACVSLGGRSSFLPLIALALSSVGATCFLGYRWSRDGSATCDGGRCGHYLRFDFA